MMKFTAVFATLVVSGLILARYLDASDSIILVLFSVAVLAISALLIHGFALTQKIIESEASRNRFFARAHIVAHIIPLSYLFEQYQGHATLALNLVYLVPLLFFYYSGRCLWRMLFARFGTKMYLFFVFGNTGMMTGITVFSVLALVFPESFGPAPFSWVVLAYFAVHFLLTGSAIMQIDRDLKRKPSSPVNKEKQVN